MLRHYQYPVRTIMYRLYASLAGPPGREPPHGGRATDGDHLAERRFFAFRSRQAVARPVGRMVGLAFSPVVPPVRRGGLLHRDDQRQGAHLQEPRHGGTVRHLPGGRACRRPAVRQRGTFHGGGGRAAQGQGVRLVRLQHGLFRPQGGAHGVRSGDVQRHRQRPGRCRSPDPGCRARTRRLQAAPRLG